MTAVEFERTASAATNSPIARATEIAAALRARVLTLAPTDISVESNETTAKVWGVVIETAHPDVITSLIALADGSVSLYVSDGNGCVGCGAHRDVRFAAADLLQVAQSGVDLATPTEDRAYPPPGSVQFYFLSFDGLRAVQVRLEELNQIDAQLSVLYFAAQRVANLIERVGAGQSLAREIQLALQSAPPTNTGSPSCLSVGSAVRRLRT
jgi:hypothetical protein